MRNKIGLIIVFLIGFVNFSYSQGKGYLGGFQFKGMIGSGLFNNGDEIRSIDSVSIKNSQNFGYVFGMTIRKHFGKSLAIESGLRFVQRNYTTQIDSIIGGTYSGKIDYRVVAYEIPLKAMVKLRAADNSFFSVSLGVQMDLYPSDIFASNYDWQVQVTRKSWIQGSFLANAGWEINPKELGTFYVGASYNQPFGDPLGLNVGRYNTPFAESNILLNGTYISLDFRYYFQVSKNQSPN